MRGIFAGHYGISKLPRKIAFNLVGKVGIESPSFIIFSYHHTISGEAQIVAHSHKGQHKAFL